MNKYDILGIVGEGAYGIVYKARNKETGEIVAIKKFKESEDDENVKQTTIREVKMLRLLKQQNIVTLIEAFKKKNRIHLVFEYIEKNLLEILEERTNGLETEHVRLYIYQLLRAIEFCHRHNVLHRDIKPENLLVDIDTHQLRLCDFGFARSLSLKGKDAQFTDYVATRWYRAPELLLSTNYGREIDIWAIGCIMGEITDGDALFPGESEIDQLFCIQKVMGKLPSSLQERFDANPRFVGFKFPELSKQETLEKKYAGKMSAKALNLMNGMLTMEVEKRLTAIECLAHPYFDGLRDTEVEAMIAKHQQQNTATSGITSNSQAGINNAREQSKSRASVRSTMHSGDTSQQKLIKSFSQNKNSHANVTNSKLGQKAKSIKNGQQQQNQNQQVITNLLQASNVYDGPIQNGLIMSGAQSTTSQHPPTQLQMGANSQQSKYSAMGQSNCMIGIGNGLDSHTYQGNTNTNHSSQKHNSVQRTTAQSINGQSHVGPDSRASGGQNFVASSNLSQFLLKKGSSGTSLHHPGHHHGGVFDMAMQQQDEYSYKINLESINPKQQTRGQASGVAANSIDQHGENGMQGNNQQSTAHEMHLIDGLFMGGSNEQSANGPGGNSQFHAIMQKNSNGSSGMVGAGGRSIYNNLFKEVIVEDENEENTTALNAGATTGNVANRNHSTGYSRLSGATSGGAGAMVGSAQISSSIGKRKKAAFANQPPIESLFQQNNQGGNFSQPMSAIHRTQKLSEKQGAQVSNDYSLASSAMDTSPILVQQATLATPQKNAGKLNSIHKHKKASHHSQAVTVKSGGTQHPVGGRESTTEFQEGFDLLAQFYQPGQVVNTDNMYDNVNLENAVAQMTTNTQSNHQQTPAGNAHSAERLGVGSKYGSPKTQKYYYNQQQVAQTGSLQHYHHAGKIQKKKSGINFNIHQVSSGAHGGSSSLNSNKAGSRGNAMGDDRSAAGTKTSKLHHRQAVNLTNVNRKISEPAEYDYQIRADMGAATGLSSGPVNSANNNDLMFNPSGGNLQHISQSGRAGGMSKKQMAAVNGGFGMMHHPMTQGIKGMGSFGGATEADEQYNYSIPSQHALHNKRM